MCDFYLFFLKARCEGNGDYFFYEIIILLEDIDHYGTENTPEDYYYSKEKKW